MKYVLAAITVSGADALIQGGIYLVLSFTSYILCDGKINLNTINVSAVAINFSLFSK
jgi:hypothetical protein